MDCEDCVSTVKTLPGKSEGRITLPRVEIKFCTQCRWMLRSAWYAQELLTSFSQAIGEIALVPVTGGTFIITLIYRATGTDDAEKASKSGIQAPPAQSVIIWDRRVDGGFPDVKVLKQKVRDLIDPGKSLGHSDKPHPEAQTGSA